MEPNEQSELTSKIKTRLLNREQADSSVRWRLEGRGRKKNVKRSHGHGQQCGDLRDGLRGINNNGEYKIKRSGLEIFMYKPCTYQWQLNLYQWIS